ncbi:hypothetical protein V9T40_008483 [Parthenolecanium corni]|uniref:Uncharacterized protein n=1 Tax=Parthenolecanium corni TaxID=536013 RepID=A0AAN9TLS4_9HEMI
MRKRWTRFDSDSYANKVRSVAERFNAVQSLSRRLEQSALSRRSRQSPRQLSYERRKTSSRPDPTVRTKSQERTGPEKKQHERDGYSRKHIHPCVCDISPVKLRQIDQMVESRRVSRAELQRRLERVHDFLRNRTDHTKRRDEADVVKQRVRAAKLRSDVERKARIEAEAKDAESRLNLRRPTTRKPRRQQESLRPLDDFDELDESPPPKEASHSKKRGKAADSGPSRRSKKSGQPKRSQQSKSKRSRSSSESHSSKSSPKPTRSSRQKRKQRDTPSSQRSKSKRGRQTSRDREDRGSRTDRKGRQSRGGREDRGSRTDRKGRQSRGGREDSDERGGRQGRGRRGGREDGEERQGGRGRQDSRGRQGRGGRQGRQQRAKDVGQPSPKQQRAQQREQDRERRQRQRAGRQAGRTPSVDKKIQKVVIRKVRRQPAPQRESYSTLEPPEPLDWRKAPTFVVHETKTSRLRRLESGYCQSRSRSQVIEKRYKSLTPEQVHELIRRPPPSQARLTRTWSVRLQMAKKLDLSPKLKYRRPSFEPGYRLMLKYRPWPDPVKWKIQAKTSLNLRTRPTKSGATTTSAVRGARSARYGPSPSGTKPTGPPSYGTTSYAPNAGTTTRQTGGGTSSTLGTMTTGNPAGFTQGTKAPTTKSPTESTSTRLTLGTKPTTKSPTVSGLNHSTNSPMTKSPTASTTSLTQGTRSSTTKSPTPSTTSPTSGTTSTTKSPTQRPSLAENTKNTSPTPSTTSRTQSTRIIITTKSPTYGIPSSTPTAKPKTKGPVQSKSQVD